MAYFMKLLCLALAVFTVAANEQVNAAVREKKHAYYAPGYNMLAYSDLSAYPYNYPATAYTPFPYAAASAKAYAPYSAMSTYATFPAKTYAAPGIYADDDGSYWPGKYLNTAAYSYPYFYR